MLDVMKIGLICEEMDFEKLNELIKKLEKSLISERKNISKEGVDKALNRSNIVATKRDFFGRAISTRHVNSQEPHYRTTYLDIIYRYSEGSSSAIRKFAYIKDILK